MTDSDSDILMTEHSEVEKAVLNMFVTIYVEKSAFSLISPLFNLSYSILLMHLCVLLNHLSVRQAV